MSSGGGASRGTTDAAAAACRWPFAVSTVSYLHRQPHRCCVAGSHCDQCAPSCSFATSGSQERLLIWATSNHISSQPYIHFRLALHRYVNNHARTCKGVGSATNVLDKHMTAITTHMTQAVHCFCLGQEVHGHSPRHHTAATSPPH